MKKSSETLKTILIVLLSLLTVVLLAGFFAITVVSEALSPADIIFELKNLSGNNSVAAEDENLLSSATYPCQIVFFKGSGDLFFPANLQGYENALENTVQLFQEAVGSASDFAESTVDTYLVSLLGYGILYYFDYPVPIEMLYAWSDGVYTGESINVSRMMLRAEGGISQLIIMDEEGRTFLSDTQSDSSFVESMCRNYPKNGTVAAMIPNINAATDTPILEGVTKAEAFTLLPSIYETEGELSGEIMETFSVNPYLMSVYRDVDAVVYMEGDRRVRLYADGHISFSDIALKDVETQPLEGATLLSAVEEARKVAFSVWDQLSFEKSRLSLSEIVENDQGCTVYFEAYIGGVFVSRGDHAAAAVTVKNGKIAGVSIYPLRVAEAEKVELMPYTLAQAVSNPNAELRICYKLENNTLTPRITDMKGGR